MIVIDIETSGVNPEKHSIISIGALEFEDPANEFYGECKVWDGAHIEEEALNVNGFSKEDITDETKQSLEILMKGFLKWSESVPERTLAGHNIGFDTLFLRDSAERFRLNWNLARRVIDTHSLTYMHMVLSNVTPPVANNRTSLSSSVVQEYVGIPEEPHPHNALTGAKVAAEAISRLLYHKTLLDDFKDHEIVCRKFERREEV